MGFFARLFGLSVRCPFCGKPGAREMARGYRCPNPTCRNYDENLARQRNPRLHRGAKRGLAPADFSRPVTIMYRNWQGLHKQFTCDRNAIVMKRRHVLVRVAPEGACIALDTAKIANWQEIKPLVQPPKPITGRLAKGSSSET